jgi:glucan endo-1,3-alpha-glucosidase
VLNVATPKTDTDSTIVNAFAAAEAANFHLFFSFDYLGGAGPWTANDIETVLGTYKSSPAHLRTGPNNLPMVSTFEGPDNAGDWQGISASVGGIFFVPDWSSAGPSQINSHGSIVNGAFSWGMWPADPNTDPTQQLNAIDSSWTSALGDKPYMMGVSPWFFTNLPDYNKKWLFNVDTLWHTRWEQAAKLKPAYVEIVTWNDFGESHYIGPIVQSAIPSSAGADATWYVDGKPHDKWRDLLPYYISAVKGTPKVDQDKVVFWYRTTPKAVGNLDGVGGGQDCGIPNDANPCYNALEEITDAVYVVVLLTQETGDTTVSIEIEGSPIGGASTSGGNSTLHFGQANLISAPFGSHVGAVTVTLTRNGKMVLTGKGPAISANPGPNGLADFNPFVGAASQPSS